MVWASLQLTENLTTEGFSCMCKKDLLGAPHRQHILKQFLTGDAEISGLPESDISFPHTSPPCPPRLSPSIALHPLEKELLAAQGRSMLSMEAFTSQAALPGLWSLTLVWCLLLLLTERESAPGSWSDSTAGRVVCLAHS